MKKKPNPSALPNPWQSWLDEKQAPAIDAEISQAEKKPGKPAPEWSGKTVGEYRKLIRGLEDCVFVPGSYAKRFVRNISGLTDGARLTVKQEAYLKKLYHSYRRQIPEHGELCPICGKGGK